MKLEPIFSDEDSDLRLLAWRSDRNGYARTTFNMKPKPPVTKLAHHMVCERIFGRRPNHKKLEVCDHIDGNKLNNCRKNLRIVDVRSNNLNRNEHRLGKLPYASLIPSGKYQSLVKIAGVSKYLGVFKTAEEAHEAGKMYVCNTGNGGIA